MVLLIGLYLDPDAARLGEFLTCLERNVANRAIDEVHVFVEEEINPADLAGRYRLLRSRKVRLVVTGVRVTYAALFAYANCELPGRRVIVANADIFFDHTLVRLADYDLADCLLCLSRWDVHADGTWSLFDFEASQDAWIFQAPLRDVACDFPLGILGCDNRLAWEAEHAGLMVANPSRSVRAYHLHLTGIRRYTAAQRLGGAVRGVTPEALETSMLASRRVCVARDATIPTAAVAFREDMGYTVDRLTLGASSHNNDVRPFTAIPDPLAGRPFTQVVACSASPVELEFLSAGHVCVLAGTDWYGYFDATDWLRHVADAEPLPLVEARHRPAFEVWSLRGDAGDRYVSPTQVALVAAHLEKR
jgi:hypothetical protein